jgi:hypothetical protein
LILDLIRKLLGLAPKRGMGFRPGPEDPRDYALAPHVQSLPDKTGSKFWSNPLRLDQLNEGSCVGHGWVQSINSQPKIHRYDHDVALNVYHKAQKLDEFPDTPPAEGTSVRAGGKACRAVGYIQSFAFTYNVNDIAKYVLNKGTVVLGCDWFTGMDNPSPGNGYFVAPTGKVRGGHCVVLDGVQWNGDSNDHFRILNSWGPGWGDDGRCNIRVNDLQKLLDRPSGVACTAVES